VMEIVRCLLYFKQHAYVRLRVFFFLICAFTDVQVLSEASCKV
jgi:hypothetical protein